MPEKMAWLVDGESSDAALLLCCPIATPIGVRTGRPALASSIKLPTWSGRRMSCMGVRADYMAKKRGQARGNSNAYQLLRLRHGEPLQKQLIQLQFTTRVQVWRRQVVPTPAASSGAACA